TEQHPDVVAARRHLRDLQAQLSSGDSSEGRSQVPNATHEQIRLRLVEAEARLATMKQRLDDATAVYNNLKTASAGIPDVEAMQKDLDRDYDVLKKSYDDLARRREATVLSQAADEKTNRTQFVIIDPPSVPLRPSSPNFALMFVLVLVGGI